MLISNSAHPGNVNTAGPYPPNPYPNSTPTPQYPYPQQHQQQQQPQYPPANNTAVKPQLPPNQPYENPADVAKR